ncbi:MAG: prolyl oligopeptidase family serine peptidase [Candidatus Acidiferrales bacterium]
MLKYMNRLACWLLLFGVLAAPVFAQEPTVDGFAARTYRSASGAQLPYRLFVPIHYDAAKKYPLVLWLHGAAGRGADNLLQISGGNKLGSHAFTDPQVQAKNPVFVLAPQCPLGHYWTFSDTVSAGPQLDLAFEILQAIRKEFNIDSERVYVSGQSMGGAGAWAAITSHPSLFAAAVPLCAYGDPSKMKLLAGIPIWAFQGTADEVVPLERVHATISALRAAGGHPKYTEYPGVGHAVWEKAFLDPDLVPWVLAQRRAADPE